MRVSEKGRYDFTNARVERAKESNLKVMEELSTQKKINRVSDEPINLGHAIKLKGKVSATHQYTKNINYAKGLIERTESVVGGINGYLMRAKELALGMSNDTYGPESRIAVAQEMKEIINEVVGLGNSSFNGKYIFSGFRTGTPPLMGDGTYVGDDGAAYIQVDEGQFKQINVRARDLFEANEEERLQGHFDLIHGLTILRDGLEENDPTKIRRIIDELDFHMEKVSNYQAKLGAIANSLGETEKRLDLHGELDTSNLSNLEDADVFKTSSDFKRTEAVLQSTLMASNKLLQPSLLNFLQ
jgi:flagellar hook-associated protein 3 FlgL